MTIGDGITYGAFWIGASSALIAWFYFRSPRHRHKWKETERLDITRVRTGTKIGERVFCVCEDCGEPKSFDI